MTTPLAVLLAPFADALPVPPRLVAARRNGRLSVPIRAGVHRFHRDLPESAVWGYDGTVPGPTIEAEAGHPVTVAWRNELDGALPVVVTTALEAGDASGARGPWRLPTAGSSGTGSPRQALHRGCRNWSGAC